MRLASDVAVPVMRELAPSVMGPTAWTDPWMTETAPVVMAPAEVTSPLTVLSAPMVKKVLEQMAPLYTVFTARVDTSAQVDDSLSGAVDMTLPPTMQCAP